jgi:predicted metal-dependent phosphoesterase TrpH
MQVKASLHIHTHEDKLEGKIIHYSVYDLIDRAKKLDFKVLGLTCHDHFVYKKEHGDYAKKNGILLIPGIEISIRDKKKGVSGHVLVLNCDEKIDNVKTLDQLRKYKKNHPEIFIIAAHPNPNSKFALGLKVVLKNIDLFDGLENTWMYSRFFNVNRATRKFAKKNNKPFISSADLHSFNYKFFETDYIVVELKSLNVNNLFEAIRKNNFKNITAPKNFFEAFFLSVIAFSSALIVKFHNDKEYFKQRRERYFRYRPGNC